MCPECPKARSPRRECDMMKDVSNSSSENGKSTETIMFRDLASDVQELLKNLSMYGYIYIGRTGVGLTTSFRKETFKVGTIKACKEATQFVDEISSQVLEVVAMEGPKWVPFRRIEETVYGVKLPEQSVQVSSEKR